MAQPVQIQPMSIATVEGTGFPAHQPVIWMPSPGPVPGCPPGMEYLTKVDSLIIKQHVALREVTSTVKLASHYKIENSDGQQVYYASEESDPCKRQCCRLRRGFDIKITDNIGQEVINLHRDFKWCACWSCCAKFDCCGHEVIVESPPGQTIGHIRQGNYCQTPHFFVQDQDKCNVFKIEGPCCVCSGICCTADTDFLVTSCTDGGGETEIAKIRKKWVGYTAEMLSDADNFILTFPLDLDVKMKSSLIAAVFLLDFLFFERPAGGRRRRRRGQYHRSIN